jgi:hypothetical protein
MYITDTPLNVLYHVGGGGGADSLKNTKRCGKRSYLTSNMEFGVHICVSGEGGCSKNLT